MIEPTSFDDMKVECAVCGAACPLDCGGVLLTGPNAGKFTCDDCDDATRPARGGDVDTDGLPWGAAPTDLSNFIF